MRVHNPLTFNHEVKAFVQHSALQGKVKSNPTRPFYEYMSQILKLSPSGRASKRNEITKQDMVYYKSWHGPVDFASLDSRLAFGKQGRGSRTSRPCLTRCFACFENCTPSVLAVLATFRSSLRNKL